MKAALPFLLSLIFTPFSLSAQHHEHAAAPAAEVAAQPLLAQAVRLQEALTFSGNALSAPDAARLRQLTNKPHNAETVSEIQEILDPYCINFVNINPEGRVKVERGPARAVLVQGAWTSFLVKITNEAGITARLEATSPNAAKPFHSPSFEPIVKPEHILSEGQVADRFAEIQMLSDKPLQPNLSGLKLEYAVVQIYSKDAGQRELEIGYHVGQGSQDIGFRNSNHILFEIKPAVKVTLNIRDTDGNPAMASLLITGEQAHQSGKFNGIYPLPSRRVAAYDEYPDFFFQPQIYRNDGEHVMLPAGKYHIRYTRGPEYIPQQLDIAVPETDSFAVSLQLERWIDMKKLGWHSADHHVHAAGCSHYDSPTEGVDPKDIWRQALGEDLNVAANLAWGPSWYHQKTFFTGKDEPLSNARNIMRNDVEVSGFPSSHAGHIVLLRIKEDDYPGTTHIEQWPTWTAPVLAWAKSQGGVVGYAHSGWGLEPTSPTNALPNYIVPKMDGIGANEFIVTVTKNLVDFYSAGDTPAPWELNMYYHTLNCGFKTMLSGETDFPCITDARVGQARSYFRPEGGFSYDNYVESIKNGKSYMSDGKSHLMDFSAGAGSSSALKGNTLSVKKGKTVSFTAKAAAYLLEKQDSIGNVVAHTPLDKMPYWDIERARIGTSRKVKVQLIINGNVAEEKEIPADGSVTGLQFSYTPENSCWAALRIFPSSHSNPIFIETDGQPVQEKKSAEWCLAALDQCWKMKEPLIKTEEKKAAEMAYAEARKVYRKIIDQPGLH